jgi:hypothetical protein
MMRRLRMIVVAVSAGLCGLSAGVAQATTAPYRHSWHQEYVSRSRHTQGLGGVTATGIRNAWAVGWIGNGTLLLHWNGKNWRREPATFPAGFGSLGIQATSAHDIWISGQSANGAQIEVHSVGAGWSTLDLPRGTWVGTATALDRNSLWGLTSTAIWHWDGSAFSTYTLPGELLSIAGAGSNLWVLTLRTAHGHLDKPVLYRWNGQQFVQAKAPPGPMGDDQEMAASDRGQLWISPPSSAQLDYWNGRSWTRHVLRNHSAAWVIEPGLTYDGHDGVWAGPYAHWTGHRWINAFPPGPSFDLFDDLYGVTGIPGSHSYWGVGKALGPKEKRWNSLIDVYGRTP